MSYSGCLNCGQMVSMYEKYCPKCIEKYKLTQDKTFWENCTTQPLDRFEELLKDSGLKDKL